MSWSKSSCSRAAMAARRAPRRGRVPEQAVVDEHEPRARLGGALEELALGRDAGHDRVDLVAPGYLEAVGAVVGEGPGSQQRVEVGDEVARQGHRLRLCERMVATVSRDATVASPAWRHEGNGSYAHP